jgi:Holliday junction resolvase
MTNPYVYGKRKELQVAECLERDFACSWSRAPASRGAVDIFATMGSIEIAIQVKATRAQSISSSRLSMNEESRLLEAVRGTKTIPILALVTRNQVYLIRVPDYKILWSAKLRPLRYEYPDEW